MKKSLFVRQAGAQGGRAKIFLISILLFVFGFCFAGNARATGNCEAAGFDCISESMCSASGKKSSTEYICNGYDATVVCCVDKTCAENGFTCESASATCAKNGTGSCPSADKPKCCNGVSGSDEAKCKSAGGHCYDGNADSGGNCPAGENQIGTCDFANQIYCCKKTAADTKTDCESSGGHCYQWPGIPASDCPNGETLSGVCDMTNNINCCKKGDGSGSGNGIVPDELAGLPTNPNLIYGIVENVADWLLSLIGILAIIGLVVAGIQYYLVATDEKMMETAKKTMTASIIGLVVALSGYIVIYTIDTILNAGL